jgi:hypothetical protein
MGGEYGKWGETIGAYRGLGETKGKES